ncbi:inositol monophosphatase family protein [Enhygromyxa salina]|uniref:inositol monophosphatase family protein n=1 Tax=Enhygromyxa salina TaxID=215803 RepID=UPI0004E6DCB1|nr:inositol monophosphatase family protein [Enhygromyxa salina]
MATGDTLGVIEEAARAGGDVLVKYFHARDPLEVTSKGPADFVSRADLEAEAAIRAVLLGAYPDAAYRGEESEYHQGTSALEWVVDPLDGTTNFLSGIPHFAVSIALREAGRTVAGMVYQPLTGDRFAALRGAGASLNGAPIHVSARCRWEQVVLATGIPHRGSRHHEQFLLQLVAVRDRVGGLRRFGSAALDLAWVAAGRFDGFWEQGLSPWDVAAGNLLVEEAGGVVTGLRAQDDPHTGASVLAASPQMHEQLTLVFGGAITLG